MRTFEQGIQLPNSAITLTRSNGNSPDVAPSDAARLFYNKTLGALMLSVNGGAYQELQASGAAGDSLTIGGDVTLTRTGANALGITEAVTLTAPAAAAIPLSIVPATSQSGDLLLITDTVPTNRVRVTKDAAVVINGTGTVSASGINAYGLMVRTNSASETEHVFLRNLETTGSVKVAMVNNSPGSGNFMLGGATATSPSSLVQNRIGIHAAANTGIFLYTTTSGQTINLYPGGTTVKYTFDTSLLTLADAVDIGINATTGTKIGQSTSKISAYGNTPVVRPAAYTQTYATATRTHSNPTATALTDNTAGSANTTLEALTSGTVYSSDVAAIRNNFADLAAAVNAIIVDLANNKQISNQVIDDLQLEGWLQ